MPASAAAITTHHASGTASSAASGDVAAHHAHVDQSADSHGNVSAAALKSAAGRLNSQNAHSGSTKPLASQTSRRDDVTPCRCSSRSRRGRLARPSSSSVVSTSVARGIHVRTSGSILSQSASRGHSHAVRNADRAYPTCPVMSRPAL